MRKWIVIVSLLLIFSGIAALFYYNEWVYLQPTPVPKGYRPVAEGSIIPLKPTFAYTTGQPLFLHFFNPDCPCSRFNITHFKSLVKQYGSKVQFVVVVVSKKDYTSEAIRARFGLTVPVTRDSSLAAACGVYATPQAVLLNEKHELCYRGNYNRSRYCTNAKSSYAQIALAHLLQQQPIAIADPMALKAYGCSLPGCTNE